MVNKIKQVGMFFVLCKDTEELWNENFHIACEKYEFGNTDSQEQVWKRITKSNKNWKGCPYWYFPRGRVDKIYNESKSRYEIVLNEAIALPTIIEKIKGKFNLRDKEVKIRTDNSGEYTCN